jgi:hypothetical protein
MEGTIFEQVWKKKRVVEKETNWYKCVMTGNFVLVFHKSGLPIPHCRVMGALRVKRPRIRILGSRVIGALRVIVAMTSLARSGPFEIGCCLIPIEAAGDQFQTSPKCSSWFLKKKCSSWTWMKNGWSNLKRAPPYTFL